MGVDTLPHRFNVTHIPARQLHANNRSVGNCGASDAQGFESHDYYYVRKVVSYLDPKATDTFIDIGCGKGRVLCVFAQSRLRKCIGIELFPSLCEAANANAASLRNRQTEIVIQQTDAAKANYSEGTIFFLFNPFGKDTLRQVVRRIEDQCSKRPLVIVYYKDVHHQTLEDSDWLTKIFEFRTFYGVRVSFWVNTNCSRPNRWATLLQHAAATNSNGADA